MPSKRQMKKYVPLKRERFTVRVCAACRRAGGTASFRYVKDGAWKRDYFHPHCFKRFVATRCGK